MHKSPSADLPKYAATLALTEVGLGSLLHALSVPMTGQFLSLNQAIVLSRATWSSGQRTAGASISTTVAILKTLAPAGKKLAPMLAITVQGLLFSVGPILLGPGLAGALLGMALSAFWAYLQPVLIYLLIFGKAGVDIVEYLVQQLKPVISVSSSQVLLAVGALVLAKIILGAVLITGLWKSSSRSSQWLASKLDQVEQMGRERLRQRMEDRTQVSPVRGALRDLMSPLFLVSVGMAVAFFWITGESSVAIAWQVLRFVAVGYLLYFGVRLLPIEKVRHPLLKATLQRMQSPTQ